MIFNGVIDPFPDPFTPSIDLNNIVLMVHTRYKSSKIWDNPPIKNRVFPFLTPLEIFKVPFILKLKR